MTNIYNVDDLKALAIAVHGNQKKYNFNSIDEMVQKLESLERMNILLVALDKIAHEERNEPISASLARVALELFKMKGGSNENA